MKVKDLINHLTKMNQEMIVLTGSDESDRCYEIDEVDVAEMDCEVLVCREGLYLRRYNYTPKKGETVIQVLLLP